MDNCSGNSRCLICRRVAVKNTSINLEIPVSNQALLQDFLYCFHINVLDSKVHDLSTSCQFCPTCEQFIAEWSSIQTQMTQLTRRAAQLKFTLSALLLSAPQIHVQNHDDHVAEIINNRIQNSQEIELPVLLQQTVDSIRNELRRKYSVRVMLDKIQHVRSKLVDLVGLDNAIPLPEEDIPSFSDSTQVPVQFMSDKIPLPPVLKLEPLPTDNSTVDEAWDHWECEANIQLPVVPKIEPLEVGENNDDDPLDQSEFGAEDSDDEYTPSEDEMDNGEGSERILGMRMETEEDANSNGSHLQDSNKTNVKAASRKTSGCPRKSEIQPAVVPDGPNKFKYNGYGIRLNDQDKCYYCGVCNLRGHTTVTSTLAHIRKLHYTAEEKIKFTAVKTSDTEWLYGGKYKIIQVDQKFKCVTCGSAKSCLYKVYRHIRTQHIDLECPDEGELALLPTQDLLGIKTEEAANLDDSSSHSVDTKEMNVKTVRRRTNAGPKRKKKRYANYANIIPDGPNRFKYKGMSFQRNEEDQTYTCDACGFKSGPNFTSIRCHIMNHFIQKGKRERRPVVTPHGPNRFKYNGYDIRLNDEDECYYCGVCNYNCGSRLNTVLGHIRENHYTVEDKIKFTTVRISNSEWLYGGKYKIIKLDEKKFKCVSCGIQKYRLHRVVTHIRTHHVELEGADKIVPLPVTDTPPVNDLTAIQGKFQSVPHTFNPADNKFTCGVCGSRVLNRDGLASHIRQHHSDPPKRIPCEICGMELLKGSYPRHIKAHQTGPMKCPHCFKQFLNAWSFKKHMELHELGEMAKKHGCAVCGKRFFTFKNYKDHERLHTGEKPYECQICGAKFPGSSYLTRHRQTVHGIQPKTRRVVKFCA